jgi:hypothetical protein
MENDVEGDARVRAAKTFPGMRMIRVDASPSCAYSPPPAMLHALKRRFHSLAPTSVVPASQAEEVNGMLDGDLNARIDAVLAGGEGEVSRTVVPFIPRALARRVSERIKKLQKAKQLATGCRQVALALVLMDLTGVRPPDDRVGRRRRSASVYKTRSTRTSPRCAKKKCACVVCCTALWRCVWVLGRVPTLFPCAADHVVISFVCVAYFRKSPLPPLV